jgi:hypothetical protein
MRPSLAALGWLRPSPLFLVAVGWLTLLGAFGTPLAELRPAPPERRAALNILVTSSSDSGPGSLREAIFTADRAQGRARIEVRVARIVLETPLPPLVNPEGVMIEAIDRETEIDGRALLEGPVLDLAAPRSVVLGVAVRGAAGQGILVRASGARLRNLVLAECDVGVYLADGADDLSVEFSAFEQNGTGVRLGGGASQVSLSENRFRKHERAAVWAVSPTAPLGAAAPGVVVRHNHFEDDRISVLLINVPGRVEDNHFARAGEAAVHLTGPGAVRRNRIQGGARVGLFADAPGGALIEDNEVDHNVAVGLLLRQARSTDVVRNRVYENGYGIVVVFGDKTSPPLVAENLVVSHREDGLYVVGGSPTLRGNHVIGNRRAAVRVLDYLPIHGAPLVGAPLLQGNLLHDNGVDAPVRGEYRESRVRPESR